MLIIHFAITELNNDTIDSLKNELNALKMALVDKDNELKMTEDSLNNKLTELQTSLVRKDSELKATEDKLLAAEKNEIKREQIEAEVMGKVNIDILDLLEAELQCSICSEIAVDVSIQ